jgi:hypothetical protein
MLCCARLRIISISASKQAGRRVGYRELGVGLRPIGAYAPVGIINKGLMFWQGIGPGRWSGFYFPQSKVLEYLFYLPAIALDTLSSV